MGLKKVTKEKSAIKEKFMFMQNKNLKRTFFFIYDKKILSDSVI